MRCLKQTTSIGIRMQGCAAELDSVMIGLWPDANFADEKEVARSTSGHIATLESPNSWVLLEWAAKQQTSTARHTAEAELTSLDAAMYLTGLPIQGTVETILTRQVRMVVREDNSAAAAAIRRGFSRKMSYLPKTQKVSISALHEIFVDPKDHTSVDSTGGLYVLVDQPSETQCGDLLTKGLGHEAHWRLVEMVGLAAAPVEGWPAPTTTTTTTRNPVATVGHREPVMGHPVSSSKKKKKTKNSSNQ
jgi:hypothetical protein